jgi:hypothetical protein
MGIFDTECDLFTDYRVTIQLRDKLMGGIPKNPAIIEGWLRSKAGIEQQEEVRQAMLRTLLELGAEVHPSMTFDELEEASRHLAASKSTNGFKVDGDGLYLESRAVKAMLKESTNVLFAGERWGKTKKGPKSFLAERVFVNPDHVTLGIKEPSGVELFIGHTSGPQGRQSNLTYHEYVEVPELTFTIRVAEDAIARDQWALLWVHAQENGLGALRSQGFGRFDVTAWERV